MALHKEWCKQIFVSESLEMACRIRATIKPAYQVRISIDAISHFGLVVVFSSQRFFETGAKISSNQRPGQSPHGAVRELCCLFAVAIELIGYEICTPLKARKLGPKLKKELKACHSFRRPPRF